MSYWLRTCAASWPGPRHCAGRRRVSVAATGGVQVASWTGLLEDGVARSEQLALRPWPAGWGDRTGGQIESGDVEELLLAAEAATGRRGGCDHGEYRRWLRETVGELNASHLEVLEALRDLGGILATANYDGLLEKVTGPPPVTWQDAARAQVVLRGDERAIVHLHGFSPICSTWHRGRQRERDH